MSCIDTIKHIYASPDLTGDVFFGGLKASHFVFIRCIEDSPGCQKLAWVIAGIFIATLYPIYVAIAAVGMVIKTISYVVNKAKDTLEVWKKLAAAIGEPYEDLQFGFVGTIIKARAFPAWMAEHSDALTTIFTLDLKECKLISLPEEIGQLRNLEELDLSDNNFMIMPEVICQLTNLRKLNLNVNRLIHLPESLNQLAKLEKLNLCINHFKTVPEVIYQLTNLQELHLVANHLTSLPDSMGLLVNLEVLLLDINGFTTIPEVVNQLSSLRYFSITRNKLTLIPDWMDQLQNLRFLWLNHNLLTTLPNSLANFPVTSSIYIQDNNISSETLDSFQAFVAQVHAADPNRGPEIVRSSPLPQNTSLKDALAFWLNEYQKKFPKLCIESNRYPSENAAQKGWLKFYGTLLLHEKNDKLLQFLNDLKTIEDFKKEPSKSHVIQRAGQMLEWAAVNDKFREGLFANLEEALGTCRDRVTLVFNGLEVLWHTSQTEQLTDKEMMQLLVGIHRLDMLRQLATKRIEELQRKDAIEVHLFYQVKLKDELKLPVSTQYMAYEATAGISDEMLAQDKSTVLEATSSPEQVAAILVEENKWIERIRAKEKKQFDQINEALNEELNQIPSEDKEQLQLEQHKKLLAKEKQQTKHLIKTLTLDFLLAS